MVGMVVEGGKHEVEVVVILVMVVELSDLVVPQMEVVVDGKDDGEVVVDGKDDGEVVV